ncbi:MAG: UDP-N-acetylglucosamine 2-epimerase (non-hydrolyzing) [Candidatus Eisenbacteria bacterium]|uniref:UDP-N-acetylglucosamine 2-epimerase (Non-hydrolyzing) n=1 Tax=Eiseniibacteriota bacterium TaxID=2212470 RepID=A0A849SJC8_UNCEI|nr:UDP-N-acetylglucosamine 2-epimerase (non-hydrolyzing) [Candidatus Eisenbacteria bacterium]
MKIGILVGTRPEIIKMAPVVRACEARGTPFLLIHTGQHYSFEMDGVFFRELGLPAPHVNLEVGSGTQVYQIGAIIAGIAPILEHERPDVLLVEGDTNSVAAAGLAAQKMGIKVGHVEAGLRSFDRTMPEEINRILTDHLSDYLFAPTEQSRVLLHREGIADERIVVTGNTVVDEVLLQRERARDPARLERFGVESGRFAIATVHRAENTDVESRLRGIFEGLSGASRALGIPVLAALHPRTSKKLEALGLEIGNGVRPLPPLGYLDFLGLHAEAAITLTDSGGLQEEACCLRVPAVTLRDNTERPESVEVGANVLAGADPVKIVACARAMVAKPRDWPNPYGDGHSGERIVDWLLARG